MKDIYMFCDDPDCPCDDMCCQDCDKREQCGEKCSAVSFKERIYASDDFLADTLGAEADKQDSWLLAVAVERIRDAAKEKKERDELRAVLKDLTDAVDRAISKSGKLPALGEWVALIGRARRALNQ